MILMISISTNAQTLEQCVSECDEIIRAAEEHMGLIQSVLESETKLNRYLEKENEVLTDQVLTLERHEGAWYSHPLTTFVLGIATGALVLELNQ